MAEPIQAPFHFDSLSEELIVQILHFCMYDEIIRFAATNRRHRNILLNSVSLKLHIELDLTGFDIIKGSRKRGGTYSRLLDELVRYRDAWLNLDFEEPTERTSTQVMSLWELRDSNYVVAFSSTSSLVWGPDSIELTPIDSLRTPHRIALPGLFHEFTLDLGQELVVLVKTDPNDPTCLEIRPCSTVTGLPHPLARNPMFTVRVGFQIPGPGYQTFILEVIDDILVTRIADIMNSRYEVIVWDWKSGALISRVGSDSGIADFSILDNTHLALFSVEADEGGPRTITLSLYSMLSQGHDESLSGPYLCASDYPCARPVLTFEFPKLDDSYKVSSRVIMRSDPIPGRVTYAKSASFSHSTALTFSVILSLLPISTTEADERWVHLRIFISSKILLSYLLEVPGGGDTITIPWGVWGIQSTRWFLCDKQTNYWVYWTSGSRFVRVDENPDSILHNLSVFDFHPPTVRRHALRDIHPPTEHRSQYNERMKDNVLEGKGLSVPHPEIPLSETDYPPLLVDTVDSDMPTIINTGFSVPIESRLPYRVVTRPKFTPSYEDWSIDGDHIIGMTPLRHNVDRLTVYKLRT